MNRMDEYNSIMQELEAPVPGLERTLDRAKRKRVRRRIVLPVVQLGTACAVFVLLVNFCTPVAYACSRIPVLKELAEAVTFSKSLSDAVDNEYVQSLYLHQEDGEVTVDVEYLIVDQKQVNVFFRLNSPKYADVVAEPEVLSAQGKEMESCSYWIHNGDLSNGELRRLTIDFVEEDVPDKIRLKLDVYSQGEPEKDSDMMLNGLVEEQKDYIAHFDFLLEFDPEFTATGKVYPINQTILLEGQEITFTEMEVYPTHLRVNVRESKDNVAWLKNLYFYVETDWGMQFETISNGISATGSVDSLSMTSFRAESNYFYDAKHLEIVVTAAEWLDKDMEKVYVNLDTGETGTLPEGVRLASVEEKEEGWLLEFEADYRKPNHHHQLFASEYYDVEGKEYSINEWRTTSGEPNENGEVLTFKGEIPLKGYRYREVWLSPQYSTIWTAEEPIRITVW